MRLVADASALPEFKESLRLFIDNLTDGGIAIVTVLGRASPFIQRNVFKYLSDEIYEASQIEAVFNRDGFSYADYNQAATFFEQDHYGITFVTPSFLLGCLDQKDLVIRGFSERGWDDQQDFIVIHKKPIETRVAPDLRV